MMLPAQLKLVECKPVAVKREVSEPAAAAATRSMFKAVLEVAEAIS